MITGTQSGITVAVYDNRVGVGLLGRVFSYRLASVFGRQAMKAPSPDAVRLAEMIVRCFDPEYLPAFGPKNITLREGCGLHEEAKRIIERNKK